MYSGVRRGWDIFPSVKLVEHLEILNTSSNDVP